MTIRSKSYLPQEFLRSLANDEFSPSLVFTGMVKKTEDSEKQILFTIGTDCTNWRATSIDLIESIEALDFSHCKNHTHPVVRIYFKKPSSEESALFALLAIDMVNLARASVLKVLNQLQNSRGIARLDCAQCIRGCGVQSPEDFFACLDRCAALCPPITELSTVE